MNIVAVVGLRWISRSARARRAVGHAVDPRLARVLHSAGARRSSSCRAGIRSRAASTPGCGAPSAGCTASSAAGACGSTTCSTSRRCCCSPPRTSRSCRSAPSGAATRRQPPLLGHLRPRLPLADDRHQHPRLRRRQVAAAHRQRRDVDSGGAADRLRRDRVRDVRQRDVVRAVAS